MRIPFGLSLIVAGMIALPPGLHAQGPGSITGRVTDRASTQPLSNVQVFIPATTLRTITNADGRYTLTNVPAGTVEVRAIRLGYSAGTQRVELAAGGTAAADFSLSASALALDELVVTGTAGETERRAQPAVVASIDVSEVVQRGTVSSVQDILTARVPGVGVTQSSGTSGTAQQIRIRGASSISLSNEPLIFIDGIRADSRIQVASSGGVGVGGQGVSRLFDINPDDIESIEVVKGPAAATLYGADASAGVIQIITKKGRVGSNSFTQNISGEYNQIQPQFDTKPNFGRCTAALVGISTSLCAGKAAGDVISDNPLLRTGAFRDGSLRSLGYSARGGGENYGYFVSLGLDDEEGTLPNNSFKRRTGRVNFNFIPDSKLSVDAAVGLYDIGTTLPINDNNIYGFMGGGYLGRPTTVRTAADGSITGGFYAANREYDAISSIESVNDALRFAPSVTVNYTPFEWFTNRLVVGGDFTRGQSYQFYPKNSRNFYSGDTDTGNLTEIRSSNDIYTLDYLGTIRTKLRENITSNISGGVQVINEIFDRVTGTGTGFVTNTNRVVGSATQISASQGYSNQRQVGVLGQVDLGWNDRLFLQLGARLDQASAFGANADPFFLPKVGVSYVISEEPFWEGLSGALPTMRLRAAYGTTGRSPTAGASLETYSAQPYAIIGQAGSAAGVIPLNPGNFDLRPERGEEFEAGFDAGFVNDRFGLELTYFNKTTRDLLLRRPIPPSSGASSDPFVNIGEVVNSGIEFALRGNLVNVDNFQWEARVAGNTLKNELVSLGDIEPFGTFPRFSEGRPLGYFSTRTIKEVITAEGDARCPVSGGIHQACAIVSDENEYAGSSLPKLEGNVSSTFTIFQRIQLTGLLDWKRGHTIYNNTAQFRDRSFANSEAGVLKADAIGEEASLRKFGPFVAESGGDVPFTNVNEAYFESADFVRLREISAIFSLPDRYAARVGATAASFTVGVRNLALWTNYSGDDPEVLAQSTSTTGSGTFAREDFLTVPQPRRLVFKLNLSF